MNDRPGSTCPIHYRYAPAAFRGECSLQAETVYVVGGLYGNVEALHAILQMRDAEARRGTRVALVFNGDFHWFDIDTASFREINAAALAGTSIRGNVETELAGADGTDCGCGYPDDVSPAIVARSNAIMQRLHATALRFPDLRQALGALPMIRTIRVAEARIGIVHGDAESLAGWAFAAERLAPEIDGGDAAARRLTPQETITRCFREAGVRAFACTHTCLPYARDFDVDGRQRVIINNGAAGMPNFVGTGYGILTRISVDTRVPGTSLYGIEVEGLRYDALPVHYDRDAWLARFLADWPAGSDAHLSYFERIARGPDFRLRDAIGGRFTLHAA